MAFDNRTVFSLSFPNNEIIFAFMSKTDKLLKLICSRIKNLREIKGFSQEYMAQKLSVSVSSYSRIERCEVNLTVEKLLQISALLQTDYKLIIEGDTLAGSIQINDPGYPQFDLNNTYKEHIEMLKDQLEYYKALAKK